MGDSNSKDNIQEDKKEEIISDKDVKSVLQKLESLDLEEVSEQGTSASTATPIDPNDWSPENRKSIIDEAQRELTRRELVNTYFVSVENVINHRLECTSHNKKAQWECLYRKDPCEKINIVRLCVLCSSFNSLAQDNWSEQMKMVIHIMRRNHLEKIHQSTFEDDITNVHWEDKQCFRIAFGFEREVMPPVDREKNAQIEKAVYDTLADSLTEDKGIVPFLALHRSRTSFQEFVRNYDGTESDRLNLAVGIIMNRLEALHPKLPDEDSIRAIEFWEKVLKHLDTEIADVIVYAETGSSDQLDLEVVEYLGVCRDELLETGSFTFKKHLNLFS